MPPTLRVAIAQNNPTIGDISGNTDKIVDSIEDARQKNADLLVTSELSLLGYPPRDLLHRRGFIDRQEEALERIADATNEGPVVIVGHAEWTTSGTGGALRNVATAFKNGERVTTYTKRLLPTYDVFDEHRYFEPGESPATVNVSGVTVGLSVCEDGWDDVEVTGNQRHGSSPITELASVGADVVVNLSASPFSLEKPSRREERFASHATDTDCPVVFANQVGANDDLIFDGNSFVVSEEGHIVTRLQGFAEETTVVDVPLSRPKTETPLATPVSNAVQAREAISLGISDYFTKTGFDEAIIGMSGGIDSSVATALAVDALGSENVYGVSLPSSVTSDESVTDAERVAKNLGIEFDVIPIQEITEGISRSLKNESGTAPVGITAENIQARVRGDILMSLANERKSLVLTPDNKSEAAVGYCTLYGDTVGAIAPLGDCYKQLVYELAEILNRYPPIETDTDVIPSSVIQKEPTAELSEDQTDEDELPPYDVLDDVLMDYIHGDKTATSLKESHDETVVDETLSRLTHAEFKRRQTPMPLRITQKAFGRGWNYPIAASYEHILDT